jgi:hypothetical protein
MTDPQVIINLGTGGSDLNGQNGSTTSADSNDARFLDWPGDNAGNYVYLPGVSGNYLSVPDEAALDITGDIDIRVQVAMDDWISGVGQSLIGKFTTTGNQQSFLFSIHTTGALRFYWSENGSTSINKISTAIPSVSDFEPLWVRVTLDVDNGASGNDVKFYTSSDGVTWSQLGSTITTAGTTNIFASTAIVETTYNVGTSFVPAGKFYRAQILDGIDGTTVLDVDTSVISSGSATSFTALTGQTVTINRSTSGRKSVAVVSPVWLFGTDDYMEVADNALLNVGANDDFTLLAVTRRWANAITGAVAAKREDDSGASDVGYSINHYTESGGTQRFLAYASDGTTQEAEIWDSSVSLGSVELLGMVRERPTSLEYYTQATVGATDVDDTTSLANSFPFTIGRLDDGSRDADMELLGVMFFRRALSSTEIGQILTYYQNKAA